MKTLYLPLTLVGALILSACGTDEATFSILLQHTNCSNNRLDYFGSGSVDELDVTISGDGLPPTTSKVSGNGAALPGIPYGTNRVIDVLAKRGGASIAWGRSFPQEVKKGAQDLAIPVLMYPTFDFRPVGDQNNQCSAVVPRGGFAAALMQDGRVLMAGGYTGPASPNSLTRANLTVSAQIFDPRTGLVSSIPDMCSASEETCSPRAYDTAVTLDDGRVLVAGGYTLRPGEHPHDSVLPTIYDPVANKWTEAPMLTARREFVPVLLKKPETGARKVEAIGGRPGLQNGGAGSNKDIPFSSSEIFDSTTNAWTVFADKIQRGDTEVALSGYKVGALGLGELDNLGRSQSSGFALVGGYAAPATAGDSGALNPTVYAFKRDDPTAGNNGQPISSFDMETAVDGPAVVGIGPQLLILGGAAADGSILNQYYLWAGITTKPDTNSLDSGGVAYPCAAVLDNYNSMIVGGDETSAGTGSTRAFLVNVTQKGVVSIQPPPIPDRTAKAQLGAARKEAACLRINPHQFLVIGGYGPTGQGAQTIGSLEVYTFDFVAK